MKSRGREGGAGQDITAMISAAAPARPCPRPLRPDPTSQASHPAAELASCTLESVPVLRRIRLKRGKLLPNPSETEGKQPVKQVFARAADAASPLSKHLCSKLPVGK